MTTEELIAAERRKQSVAMTLVGLMLLAAAPAALAADTIYGEDFDSYANNTTDPGNGKWSLITTAGVNGSNPNDYFKVKTVSGDKMLEARDVDENQIFRTQNIDISGYANLRFWVRVSESGSLESADHVKVYFQTNSGPLVLSYNVTDDFGVFTHENTTFGGTNIQIEIHVKNSSGSERYRIQEVVVEGDLVPAPEISITTPDQSVEYETNSITISGTSSNAVGNIAWTNALTGGSSTIAAGASWTISDIPLAVGVNPVTVTATNAGGGSTTDTVTITRPSMPLPEISITTPDQSVEYETNSITISGTSSNAVGNIAWVNALNGSNSSPSTVTDNFDTAHDYSGGNVAGTIWDGIRYNEGNISGVVANANTTSAGELHFESANGDWSGAGNDGLLLYINVSGDFVAEVQATSTTSGDYNGVGLMARLADPAADGDAGEDWVFLSYSTRFSQNRVRKVNNSANTQTLAAGEQPFLQIERLGDDFIFRRKANAGGAWAQIDLVTRADLNGLPLQVGIWQADFHAIADSGTVDNFSLTKPTPAGASWTVSDIPLAVGANPIIVTATNAVGDSATNTVTITRQSPPLPVVSITTPDQSVEYETNSITISGTSSNAAGNIAWTNALTGGNSTIAAGASWTISDIPLAVGANPITVTTTNSYGSTNDTVTITRQDVPLPVISITTPAQSVGFGTTALAISGTSSNVPGNIGWTNALTGSNSTIAALANWTISDIPLAVGANPITVMVTNIYGSTSDTVTITREEEPPPLLAYDGFDYSTGALSEQNGGTGAWNDKWAGDTAIEVQAPGFTHMGSSSNNLLNVVGNRIGTTENVLKKITRPLNTTIGSGTETIWVSVIIDGSSGNKIHNFSLGDGLFIGQGTKDAGQDRLGLSDADGLLQNSSITPDDPHLLVVRVDFSGGNEDAWLWIDPLLDTEPSTASADASSSDVKEFSFDFVQIQLESSSGTGVDEIRIGSTYSGVSPYHLAPVVSITTPAQSVHFETNSIAVSGTSANVAGNIGWTNALTGSNSTIAAGASWTISDIPLAEGANLIIVTATNSVGDSATDTVIITRQDVPLPVVSITTPAQSVDFETNSITISGTSSNVPGNIAWVNALTGSNSTIAAGANWTINDIPLAVGANLITVTATNIYGSTNDTVTITREEQPPPEAVTLYSEDFDSYANGTTDPGNGKWSLITSSSVNGSDPNDYFRVETVDSDKVLEAKDVNSENQIFRTQNIDIDGYANLKLWVRMDEVGNYENADYIRVYFQTNSGPLILSTNVINNFVPNDAEFTHTNATFGGTNLQIEVHVKNSESGEKYRIEEVVVVGHPAPAISITTPAQSVDSETNSIAINGTSSNATGNIAWTNALNGSHGVIEAGANWTISDIPLAVGANPITVTAANIYGSATDTVIITRQEPPPAISTTAATDVTTNAATLNGNLDVAGNPAADVYVFYGTTDETTDKSSWDTSVLVEASASAGVKGHTAAPAPATNVVLAANGGVLESFTTEYGEGWVASDLNNGVTNEDGWSSSHNPSSPQEFVYSFSSGQSATLSQAVIHGGTAEGQYFSKDIEIWTSADGFNYTQVASGTLANSANDSITLDLGGVVASNVKLVITSGHRTDYWELAELEVMGVYAASALSPNTTYYYRYFASNSVAEVWGSTESFMTLGPPAISTTAATGVGTNAAGLNGNLSVAGNPAADVYVFYGTSDGEGTKSSWDTGVLVDDDASAGSKSHTASALSTNTTYHYRYYASNSVAEVWGSTESFTTIEPPAISTTAATGVGTNAAGLNGNLSVAGNPAADVYVFYGTSDGEGTKSSWDTGVLVDDDAIAGVKSHTASALSTNTTYYYRYYASNSVAEVWGSTESFTTLGPPAITTTAASVLSFSPPTAPQKLTASDAAADDQFGGSVAISGDYAIIGAQTDDDDGDLSGSAYVFKRSGTCWIQQAKLTASDAAAGDQFGGDVAINGDYAIVGALFDDDAGGDSGSAYVFKRSGTNWNQQAKLTASDAAVDDRFGISVSISGDYAIVGAHKNDDAGDETGSAYGFKRSGTNWNEQAKLTASDPLDWDYFGWAVSISDDYAIVGAAQDDDDGNKSGSAYVFDTATWTQQHKLTASDAAAEDQFGYFVAISDNYAIVGAYLNDDVPNNSGSAYVFSGFSGTYTADLNGNLSVAGNPAADVYVFYGTNDGLSTKSSWDTSVLVDAGASAGVKSHTPSALSSNTTYYYRYFASNSVAEVWGTTVTFTTHGPGSLSTLDIGGNICGLISSIGEIRLTNNVTLIGNTVLEADSDGSGDEIINFQGFAINGGGFDLTLHSGANVTLGVLTNVNTLVLQSSDGSPVTYASAVANAFAVVTVRNDGADYGDVIFARSETSGGFLLIYDLSQLQDIDSGGLTNNYRMANHIDATATKQSTWNSSMGFNPIGGENSWFEGEFDGNAKTISSMYIAGTRNLGVFARTHNAYIHDFGLTHVEVVTVGPPGRHFGTIAGRSAFGGATGTVLSNVYATGTITSTNIPTRLGGLIGYTERASVIDSYSDVAITVTGTGGDIGGIVGTVLHGGVLNSYSKGETLGDIAWRVGGVVGTLDGGGVIDSYNEGTVHGGTHVGGGVGFLIRGSGLLRSYSSGIVTSAVSDIHYETAIGGLVGLMWSSGNTSDVISSVKQCYATGNVFAGGDNHTTVGGLVGGVWQGEVTDSYAVGDVVTGTNASGVGGLIGGASDFQCCGFYAQVMDLQRSYSAGFVEVGTESNKVGGVVGSYTNGNGSTLANNYWNSNSGGNDGGVGNGNYSGGLVDALSTPAMTNSESYTGWNFSANTGVWEVDQGHRPHLQWEAFNFAEGGGGRRVEGSFGGGRRSRQARTGAEPVLALSVNGTIVATTVASGSTFSFENVVLNPGDAILVFIQSGAADGANLVGIVRDVWGNITGLRLYDGEITLGSENGQVGQTFGADDGGDVFERAALDDSNILFSSSNGVVFHQRLFVEDGVTFAPTQTVVLTDGLLVEGVVEVGTNMTISGVFDLDAGAELTLDMGGYIPDVEYARLEIDGAVNLYGTIRVRLQNDFAPTNQSPFGVVIANSLVNSLSELRLPPLRSDQTWESETSGTSLVVRSISITDDDNDGMHDDWETETFGSTNTANQLSDFDLDGMSDYDEYVSWTDPTDHTDLLRITAVEIQNDTVMVQFPSVEGLTYHIEFMPTPGARNATSVVTIPGTGQAILSPAVSTSASGSGFLKIRTDR